jgi:membrane protease YdiL (CAAX protease family)
LTESPGPVGVTYDQLHRLGRPGVWRPLVGIAVLGLLAYVLVPLLLEGPVVLVYLAQGGDWSQRLQTNLDTEHLTPFGLGFLNVVLAASIPSVFFVSWLMHRLRPGWVSSVAPRIRWGFFAACLGLAFLALLATLIVGAFLPADNANGGTDMSGDLNSFTSTTRGFLLVVLLLTPFQAAGEEYVFRGYLTQAFGGIFRSRAVAVVVPATLFALAHGAQSWPVFVDRLSFGLVAGVLVIATGGLEAGIAMHVLNNFFAFGLALAWGDMTEVLNPPGGSWWSLPTTLTQSLLYLWLALLVTRRMGLRTTADPAVLVAP